jgi:formyl-CoA transferase
MPYEPASRALEGLIVLDLTHARAGPVCVRQLADWGANVIKVERPGNPVDFAGRHEADFQNKHRNKRSLAVNLRSEEGRAVFYRLVEKADLVVENFRPDVKTRLGFGYDTLKAKNPRIILASISAFGQDGPYKHLPGVDQVIQGMSGLMSVTGEPGRGPMRVGIAISDIVTGLYAALGILTALIERQKSDAGQWCRRRCWNRSSSRWICRPRATWSTAWCPSRSATSIPRACRPTPTKRRTAT